jgi:uncharacterized protein YkwD
MREEDNPIFLHISPLSTSKLLVQALLLLLLGTGLACAAADSGRVAKNKTFRSGQTPELLRLVNQARAEGRTCGNKEYPAAEPLQWNDKLAAAALIHAEDMAHRNYFSHTSKDGSTMVDRVRRAGYVYRNIGENIASTTDVQSVIDLWLASPGHCANLMNADFTEMGAAYAADSAKAWETRWVQVLGTKRNW